MTEEELRHLRQEIVNQRLLLNARIAEIDTQLQALCKHEWAYHQVAGEGSWCKHCGADNPDCDD